MFHKGAKNTSWQLTDSASHTISSLEITRNSSSLGEFGQVACFRKKMKMLNNSSMRSRTQLSSQMQEQPLSHMCTTLWTLEHMVTSQYSGRISAIASIWNPTVWIHTSAFRAWPCSTVTSTMASKFWLLMWPFLVLCTSCQSRVISWISLWLKSSRHNKSEVANEEASQVKVTSPSTVLHPEVTASWYRPSSSKT